MSGCRLPLSVLVGKRCARSVVQHERPRFPAHRLGVPVLRCRCRSHRPSGGRVSDLSAPSAIMARLEEIDRDLADRQNALESAARKWFVAKRNRDRDRAVAFLSAEGTVAERQAQADRETAVDGSEDEAEWEALRAVVRTLETRASIGQSLLKMHTRVGS